MRPVMIYTNVTRTDPSTTLITFEAIEVTNVRTITRAGSKVIRRICGMDNVSMFMRGRKMQYNNYIE